jgi:hypothetical protein
MWNIPSFDLLRMVSNVEPPEAGNCPYLRMKIAFAIYVIYS